MAMGALPGTDGDCAEFRLHYGARKKGSARVAANRTPFVRDDFLRGGPAISRYYGERSSRSLPHGRPRSRGLTLYRFKLRSELKKPLTTIQPDLQAGLATQPSSPGRSPLPRHFHYAIKTARISARPHFNGL
jgi:hypothetical protein